jgi:hypothetical protein
VNLFATKMGDELIVFDAARSVTNSGGREQPQPLPDTFRPASLTGVGGPKQPMLTRVLIGRDVGVERKARSAGCVRGRDIRRISSGIR